MEHVYNEVEGRKRAMTFDIEYVRAQAIENAPFRIDRPQGSYRYLFFHFLSKVNICLNGEWQELSPGSCILFTPGFPQLFVAENNRLNHDYVDFKLSDATFFEEIRFPLNTPFLPRMSEEITSSVASIEETSHSMELGAKLLMDTYLIQLFVGLSRKLHPRKSAASEEYSGNTKLRFEQTRLSMYQNPDGISVASLAKSLGFSLPRFNALYRDFFGTTPMKDLTDARIERVKELMEAGCPTREIIKRLGFSSNEYFYRWFKQHYGCTKGEFEAKSKQ